MPFFLEINFLENKERFESIWPPSLENLGYATGQKALPFQTKINILYESFYRSSSFLRVQEPF